jgi:taurine dioxygenase
VATQLAESLPSVETSLKVTPLTTRIGAEIEGVDARQPISAEQAAELRQLLNKWKVIFFRNQPITPEQHLQFASAFGPVMRDYRIALPHPDHEDIQQVRFKFGIVDRWHTDTSFMVRPAKAAVLHSVRVPPVGGDTMFADQVAAYNGLPDDVKERIAELRCIHDPASIGRNNRPEDPDFEAYKERRRKLRLEHPLIAHPLVRRHPETGEKSLFINTNLCTQIVGLPLEESDELLQYLFIQSGLPQYTCRFRWTANAIAVWDQRQTQHLPVNDLPAGTDRLMHRILVASDDIPHN